jgi:hypothetical protein
LKRQQAHVVHRACLTISIPIAHRFLDFTLDLLPPSISLHLDHLPSTLTLSKNTPRQSIKLFRILLLGLFLCKHPPNLHSIFPARNSYSIYYPRSAIAIMTGVESDGSPRRKGGIKDGGVTLSKPLASDALAPQQVTVSYIVTPSLSQSISFADPGQSTSINVSKDQGKSPITSTFNKPTTQSQQCGAQVCPHWMRLKQHLISTQASPQDSRKASAGMEDILAKLRINDSRNATPTNVDLKDLKKTNDDSNLDKLISDLSQQNKALKQQDHNLKHDAQKGSDNSSSSGRYTESYGMISSSTSHGSEQAVLDTAEMLRVKQELEAAKSVISRQEKELAESRTFKHTIDQAMGPASDAEFGHGDISEQTIGHLQSAFNASARPFTSRGAVWRSQEETRSDSDFSAASFNARTGWGQPNTTMALADYANQTAMMGNAKASQAYAAMYAGQGLDVDNFGPGRSLSGSSSSFGYNPRFNNDLAMYGMNAAGRRDSQFRSNSTLSDSLPLGSLAGMNSLTSPPLSPLGMPEQYGYAQRNLGLQPTPVSPEFPHVQATSAGWSVPVSLPNPDTDPGLTCYSLPVPARPISLLSSP